jgi:hypothetical protein
VGRDHVAVDALAFLGEPLDEAGAVGDLAARLGERLALLGGHQLRQVLLRRHHQLEPLAQDGRALLGRLRAPGRHGPRGGVDGALRVGGAAIGHLDQQPAVGGIADVELAVRAIAPGAVDVRLRTHQRWIVQLRQGRDSLQHGVLLRPAQGYAGGSALFLPRSGMHGTRRCDSTH